MNALYTSRGAKWSWSDEDYSGESLEKNAYLDLPLLLVFTIPTGPDSRFTPTLAAGPAVSLLLSAQEGDYDIKEYLNSTDVGLALGAGVGVPFSNGQLQFAARYMLGLIGINNEEEASEYKNRTLVFLGGFSVPVGRS